MLTSSSLPPQRKRPLNNPSGHESGWCTSKRFKIVSEEGKQIQCLPAIWLNMPVRTQKSLYLTRIS